MEFIAHIADRFLIHFFASGGLLILCTLGPRQGASAAAEWAPRRMKSVFDFISWALGVAVWGWAVAKLAKFWVSRKES